MQERLIYESQKSKVFHRKEKDSGKEFAVKVLNYEFPTPEDISQFFNEFDIISGLELDGIRNAVQKARENNRHVLIIEWVDGLSLKERFVGKQDDLVDVLHIAIAMAESLAEIHSHQIIDKDITPYNFVVDLQERKVRLIDFGISTNLNLKQPYIGNPERIEGTLAYVSPEQTGRMNRTVDYRTDLYSLGVTIYEMLTGQVPFTGSDAVETVHAHIAQIPSPVDRINPKVPKVLSDIVMKLLSKSADDRYQSALGLKHDLEQCLEAIESGDEPEPFPLGGEDHSSVFRLPQRLYGREGEVREILDLFETCAEGSRQLLLVGGYSGTGKTSLVHEVHKPITARRGFFCSGKFDQFQRATPYFAFLEALRELVDTLLTFEEKVLAPIRESLEEALGEEGKVLTNVLPKLEHIIGEQPPIPEVGGAEAQNRFHYVFRKFIHVLCSRDHPLVIFIDDLQWADSASLDLLHLLMTDAESSHLLLICAYRSNEVSATHPFIRTVDEIRESGLQPEAIEVGNLLREDMGALLSDTLNAEPERVEKITDLVLEKTDGNAFFATEFLKSLAEERLLEFDFGSKTWKWDSEKIRQKSIAENVVDLMAEKVNRLSDRSKEVLQVAACVGNRFDVQSIGWAIDEEEEVMEESLREPLQEGLILPLGQTDFKFSHDRIQQAVYSMVSEENREQIHLKIGRALESHLSEDERGERIFDIVNQSNKASSLLGSNEERIEMASMNLRAGSKAKLNSAFPTALEFLGCGIDLLGSTGSPWETDYQLTLDLYTEATEAAYLSGEFELMDGWFREILSRSNSILGLLT